MANYDAFISYSHAKDRPIAGALQSVMQTLGKGWWQRRSLRVFRDETSLTATPELWPSIETALKSSRYLVLMVSPEAAKSDWINKEVATWFAHNGPVEGQKRLLIALTEGELTWDKARGDFAADEAAPVPPSLRGRFALEPLWIDLRAYRAAGKGASKRNQDFVSRAGKIAARILGVPLEDLLSEEVRQQRRALKLALSAASSLAVLLLVAVWLTSVAWQQYNRAERTIDDASDTASSLVLNLGQRFRERVGMPKDVVHTILDHAEKLMNKLMRAGETRVDLLRNRAMALGELTETWAALGDMARARKVGEESLRLTKQLNTRVLPNTETHRAFLRDLSISQERLGDVLLAAGEPHAALGHYRQSLTITDRLTKAEPDNVQHMRDLLRTLGRSGDALIKAGERDTAYTTYQRVLNIAGQLAIAAPNDDQSQEDLAVSHSKLGNVLLEQGRREEALKHYRLGLAILKRVATTDPNNARWQHNLAAANSKVGDVLRELGRPDQALDPYRRSWVIFQTLAAADPGSAELQILLALVNWKLSEIDKEKARAHLTITLEIFKRLDTQGRLPAVWRESIRAIEKELSGIGGGTRNGNP